MKSFVASSLGALALLAASCATTPTAADVPEENYDFLALTTGPCIPKIGIGVEARYEAECRRMTDARRYRGTWYVDFETSFFTPVGMKYCLETRPFGTCLQLEGESLPWPRRSDCGRKFEVAFIGRRNVHPGFDPTYKIVVDKLISAKRLPDPYDEDCDPKLHPELKEK